MIVAGKSANFADKALRQLLDAVALKTASIAIDQDTQIPFLTRLPFEMLARLSPENILNCLHKARTGNYGKLQKAIVQLLATKIDLAQCTPEQLEAIHGIGPKTSRFFIMWIRPEEQYAALDVHILRWMRAIGHDVPATTPQNRTHYRRIELLFLAEATKRNKTARELDSEIWEAGAGRTQKTPFGK